MSGKWSRQWGSRFHTDMLIAHSRYFSNYDRSANLNTSYIPSNDTVAVQHGFTLASEENNIVKDLTYRLDNEWHLAQSHTLKFGTWITQFNSKYIFTLNDTTEILNQKAQAQLYALYLQDKWKIKTLELTFGLRSSYYQKAKKIYYEPRVSFTYLLTDKINFKGAWGHYYQFVNRITNENVLEGSHDFWILTDKHLKPDFAEHKILGLNYENNKYLFSVEGYFKNLENLVEFTRRYTGRADYSDYFFIGNGKAKGLEFLAQKKRGALTGWIGYTLGKVEYQFPAFNNGESFPANHDRRHEINMVSRLNLGKWTLAATWVYATGNAYTAPESQYFIPMLNGDVYSYIHVSNKNGYRLPDYQRLDLSASRQFESGTFTTEVGVSIFNVYNHKNVWYREYNLDTTPVTVTDVLMLGFTPTVYVKFNLK